MSKIATRTDKGERIVTVGAHAISYGAKLARAKVIAAYPITPQTKIVEILSEWCGSGEMEANFIKVESEHSAMACIIGASAAGARAFTATSSQGLALMHEMLHWATAGRHPVVMANVNRSMGPPWNIWADHTDSISQRDTGWMQYYVESCQEAMDTIIQAFRVSEEVLLPSMINLDAFYLSHTSESVEIPYQELVDEYLPPLEIPIKMDIKDPRAFGALARPDKYSQLRYNIQLAMDVALNESMPGAFDDFERIIGRRYDLIEDYKTDDAELILVAAGTMVSTARVAIDQLQSEGYKVGLVKLRVFRPFPAERLRQSLGKAPKVVVMDRNFSFGSGGAMHQEIKGALYELPKKKQPIIFGYIVGIGGLDVKPEIIKHCAYKALEDDKPDKESTWIGVKE